MRTIVLLSLFASASAWTYKQTEPYAREWSGDGDKPTIVCHVDACGTLREMGVPASQLVGYFGADPGLMTSFCHGPDCSSIPFETMTSINNPGSRYTINIDALKTLNAGVIVDYAYCHVEEDCTATLPSADYKGLLAYSGALEDLATTGTPVINMIVASRGYAEIVDDFQNLAIALGDPPNFDLAQHCNDFDLAMQRMKSEARRLWALGMRVTTISVASAGNMIYAAQPTDDPILVMLLEAGVPMTFIEVNDPRGGYWEYVPFNGTTGESPKMNSTYPTDIFLYDARSHGMHTNPEERTWTFDDPAWKEGQIAPWPIDAMFTYEYGAEILNTIANVFNKAKLIRTKGTCTLYDPMAKPRTDLQPGQYPCNDPDSGYIPKCPNAGDYSWNLPSPPPPPPPRSPASPLNPPDRSVDDDDDDDALPTWGIAVISLLAALFALFVVLVAVLIQAERVGKPIFYRIQDSKVSKGGSA